MILVTGSAGFIGFSLVSKLLKEKYEVIGLDNHNNYYDKKLKKDRVEINQNFKNYTHIIGDICNYSLLNKIFEKYRPNVVINLAAQAGVRFSIKNPRKYIKSNVDGFFNIIDISRKFNVTNFIYASSSSVYSGNVNVPFSEADNVDHPLNLYAATKKTNELIAHSYSNLYQLPTTGLRFFTVYGPWGRPDMAYFHFVKSIINSETIFLHNNGNHERDFTYIDDIVNSMMLLINKPAKINTNWKLDPNNFTSFCPWNIYNIGNEKPTNLSNFLNEIEKAIGIKAKIKFLPLQQGEALITHSNSNLLFDAIRYKPKYTIKEGIKNFVDWYLNYHRIKIN